eukprot:TRINITY_DN1915_c0_g1_i2.p4 TRINITY_DN1915_c0_g1~~TRINITY_DN1915_c0_g1_i2.p4  ORF type:complete len:106 (-),score=33.76 TRINITY_DN1915_c0_g1_i2:571-849(-)
MQDITSVSQFSSLLESAAASSLVVAHFWADWSKPCLSLNQLLTALAAQTTDNSVIFAKIEAEAVPELSEKLAISAVPSFIFFKVKTEQISAT